VRTVRPKRSPADMLPGWAAGVSEVSRFSCMKFLDVPGVFDYAGLSRVSGYRPCSYCTSAHFSCVGVRVVGFRNSISHPAYTPVYASLSPSRYQRKTRGRADR
jgi:hypothetical protein